MTPQWADTVIKDGTWLALGVAATLLYVYVTHRIGRFQVFFLRSAHELNVRLAKCQIGTTCMIELKAYNPSRPDIRRYVVETKIYNAGDLAAKDVKGQWCVACSEGSYDGSFPIWIDFVTKTTPHNLEPHSFGSNEITQAIMRGDVRIDVNIDLDFSGLDNEKSEHYSAQYTYSHEQKQLMRIK